MGRFFNPDNSAFQNALNSEIYVDKTGLIGYTNRVLDTMDQFLCHSRPRRFGKSITANMLTAYYSKGCDSRAMFSGLAISRDASFEKHLNRYNVIHFDVQWFVEPGNDVTNIVDAMQAAVIGELREAYPDIVGPDTAGLPDAMSLITQRTGSRFIVIIDEWDVFIRDEALNQKVQEEYIGFLRRLFKGVEPTRFLSLAYLTGILPIKRVRTQSALNNFDEFTMLDAGPLACYAGFTGAEVRDLCARYGREFRDVERWYDGYLLSGQQVYNPRAVVSVMKRGSFQSYWSQTGTFESIRPYINMNFDGLRSAIIGMISGDAVPVDTSLYQNDMVSFSCKDDVLTLLIHLGYLAYDQQKKTAYIPNEEIRQEFASATRVNRWNELVRFEQQSDGLLEATLNREADAVAQGIERIHNEIASSIQYNNENSLSSVLTIAYLSSMQYYFKPVREMPMGRGFADFVYVPKPEYADDYPTLVVELKWNRSADTALNQIREKKYPESLLQYTGNILLVGISYDKKTKAHHCAIEVFEK